MFTSILYTTENDISFNTDSFEQAWNWLCEKAEEVCHYGYAAVLKHEKYDNRHEYREVAVMRSIR